MTDADEDACTVGRERHALRPTPIRLVSLDRTVVRIDLENARVAFAEDVEISAVSRDRALLHRKRLVGQQPLAQDGILLRVRAVEDGDAAVISIGAGAAELVRHIDPFAIGRNGEG